MFNYSFSGADVTAHAYFPGKPENVIHLHSMHSVSTSIYEAKDRVRSLGFRGVRGFTRSIREISGTMIFVVIADHPLKGLMYHDPSQTYISGSESSFSLDLYETGRGHPNPMPSAYGVSADAYNLSLIHI